MIALRHAVAICGALLSAIPIPTGHAKAQTLPIFATIHDFRDGAGGAFPSFAGVTIGTGGVLYGVTRAGGGDADSCRCGVVYSVSPPAGGGGSWTETVLHSFAGRSDGSEPIGNLAIGADGVLFGVTVGTVFSLTPPTSPGSAWTETVLYSFEDPADGYFPYGGIVIGEGGVLYGTTFGGGTSDNGTVFSLTPPASPGGSWTETVLYRFTGGDDGGGPRGPLAIGAAGVLFGTGAANGGTVFALKPPASPGANWTEFVLHRFTGGSGDGYQPWAGVTIGKGGVLYGTTAGGGASLNGTVFSLTPPAPPGGKWTETVIHNFAGGNADGASPVGGIAIGRDGVLYGTTQLGGGANTCGSLGCGTVFSLTPPPSPGGAWSETVLHSFAGQPSEGGEPEASVAIGKGGVLYGTTVYGGTSGSCDGNPGCGTVFAFKP